MRLFFRISQHWKIRWIKWLTSFLLQLNSHPSKTHPKFNLPLNMSWQRGSAEMKVFPPKWWWKYTYVVALLIATDILSKLSVIIRHKTHWSVITDWWWCQMRKWMEGSWLLFLLFYALHSTPPSYLESQWWKIIKKVASFISFLFHNVWKLLGMSHLIIFHFGISHQFLSY